MPENPEFKPESGRSSVSLEQFIEQIRKEALGDFGPDRMPEVAMAGRFMGQRGPFAQLQDSQGRIQLYLRKDEIGETEEEKERFNQLIKLLDIGDFIGVRGELFGTQTGELTLHARQLVLLSKALKPLPIVNRRSWR